MAVTIHTSPQFFTPSDNPVVWTFSSNQTGQANFSYVVEAYVNGVLDSRHEIFPEVGARAHFDMASIMSVNTPVATVVQTTVGKDAGFLASCNIVVRERYGSTPSYHSSETSSLAYCFKSRLSNEEMQKWKYTDYTLGFTDPKFLTNMPNTLKLPSNSDYFISILNDSMNDIFLTFKLYEEDGTPIPGADISLPDNVLSIQINLNSDLLIGESIITQDAFDQAAYMEVFINQFGGDAITETKRFYFEKNDCGQHTKFVWLNYFGGFDSYNFTHNRVYLSQITSYRYGKQFGEWQNNLYALDASNSGTIDYLKRTNSRMQAVSGYIDEETQNYLVQSMYGSPLCYILEDDEYTRVTIEATAFELQNDLYEEEFTEVVEVSFPNAKYSQRL